MKGNHNGINFLIYPVLVVINMSKIQNERKSQSEFGVRIKQNGCN